MYVEFVGQYKKGYEEAIKEMKHMRDHNFLLYCVEIGNNFDQRKNKGLLKDPAAVGIGNHVLHYSCKKLVYDPSAHIGTSLLNKYWQEEACKRLEEEVQIMNETFFRRQRSPTPKQGYDMFEN